jgi:lysylphosphatidylglycerol synthetase-like protein (DUF2156 family)
MIYVAVVAAITLVVVGLALPAFGREAHETNRQLYRFGLVAFGITGLSFAVLVWLAVSDAAGFPPELDTPRGLAALVAATFLMLSLVALVLVRMTLTRRRAKRAIKKSGGREVEA